MMTKSPPTESPVDREREQSSIFGEMLADISGEPTFRGREKNNAEASDGSCELCVATVVGPTGLSDSTARINASFSLATNDLAATADHDSLSTSALRGWIRPVILATADKTDAMVCLEDSGDLPVSPCTGPTPKLQKASPEMTDSHSTRAGLVVEKSTDGDRTESDAALQTADFLGETSEKSTNAISTQSSFVTDKNLPAATSGPTFVLPIHVTALETHLPAMMIRTALDLAASASDIESVTAGPSFADQKDASRVKILTFDVHPAALGLLTVRMRLIGKQIEIAIDTRSEEVREILTKTKTAMVDALNIHELMLEPPEIRLTTSSPSTMPKPADYGHNTQTDSGGFTQDQGHAPHDQKHPWTPRGSPIVEQTEKASSTLSVVGKRIGFYL